MKDEGFVPRAWPNIFILRPSFFAPRSPLAASRSPTNKKPPVREAFRERRAAVGVYGLAAAAGFASLKRLITVSVMSMASEA